MKKKVICNNQDYKRSKVVMNILNINLDDYKKFFLFKFNYY